MTIDTAIWEQTTSRVGHGADNPGHPFGPGWTRDISRGIGNSGWDRTETEVPELDPALEPPAQAFDTRTEYLLALAAYFKPVTDAEQENYEEHFWVRHRALPGSVYPDGSRWELRVIEGAVGQDEPLPDDNDLGWVRDFDRGARFPGMDFEGQKASYYWKRPLPSVEPEDWWPAPVAATA